LKQTLFRYPYASSASDRVTITTHDDARLPNDFLNDNIIDFYFK
jgi:Ulp1 family protease